MNTTMWKLQNPIKNYEWGSINELSRLFHIHNPAKKPLAEVWMGAHPAGVSITIDSQDKQQQLDQLIGQNPTHILGEITDKKYHALPYLFKILSAKEPLSIQVHPELSKAKLGYERENQLGIALDSPKRNYKDPNHKPELIYAITPFWAMNGFRPIAEIIALFSQLNIPAIHHEVDQLRLNPSAAQLKEFFHALLILENSQKQQAIAELKASIAPFDKVPFNIIKEIAQKYPDDNGLFAPLMLNVIELQPGQAMFLKAQTPHAYLKGTGLEIMASSDNVLRAGLTSKYIDVEELLNNTLFESLALNDLLTTPIKQRNKLDFPVPVEDFAFEIIYSSAQQHTEQVKSAEIVLCIEGSVTISTSTASYTIKAGESVFIAYDAVNFSYQGDGILARAFNH